MLLFLSYTTQRVCPDAMLSIGSYVKGTQHGNQRKRNMATKEEISMVGFEIVAYAGDAQTDLLAALDAAREGDFEKAEQLHKDASDALIGAHDTQTKLLSQEAGGGEMEMTFIMAHAQDTLMTTMILEKQARFTIDAYKRIAELEAKLA